MAIHLESKTDEDFEKLVKSLSQFKTDFEREVATAIANEIERRYINESGVDSWFPID